MSGSRKVTASEPQEQAEPDHRPLPPGLFAPDLSLPHAFAVVSNRVSAMLFRMYNRKFGLSVTGWRVMAFLGSRAPLSAKALSELTALDQVSISRAVEQLVAKRFVLRRVDPVDRRRVLLRLTRKGKEVHDEILPVLYAIERALVAGLSEADIRRLRETMEFLKEHSTRVLAEDRDWQSLLAAHGYAGDGEDG